MSKNKLTIAINGRQYTLVSDESPEYLKMLSDHINDKVTFIRKYSSNTLGERPVILAALNICDEYFKALKGGEELKEQMKRINQKTEEIMDENRHLHELFDENEFEIDIKTMQSEIDRYKEAAAAKDDKIRHLESSVEALKLKYEKDLEKLKRKYDENEALLKTYKKEMSEQ